MASTTTINQRILNALNLKGQSNLYFAIGKSTAWDDEENPDTPLTTQSEISELIYIKKISVKQLVKFAGAYPYVYDIYGASVTVNGVDYTYVLDGNAYTEQAYMVYLSANIDYTDIAPTDTSFRQIGILLDPLDSEGEQLTGSGYLASSVDDQGQLLYVWNFQTVTRDDSQSEKIEIVVVF